ncbi:MAG: glycosyltransferase family 2 protein [Rhizobiaceae bacterium]|nr:glycosyltransferase family 2 protein [Rhizobiaceae bacterium]
MSDIINQRPPKPDISITIPIYNEVENLDRLESQLFAVIDLMQESVEVIAVNDGSTDGSKIKLEKICKRRKTFKVVNFHRNSGQTAALMAGIDHSQGDIIVALDADLQNDPKDIPSLLQKLDEGYDVVSGWRKKRKDAAIRRNLVSRIANRLISKISGVHLHDYGCTLKAYRRDVIIGFRLYGEMHRFIPIYATWMGARVTEIPVTHHARQFGQSKYGLSRVYRVLLDLIVIKFLERYLTKPIYLFGGIGALSIAISIMLFAYAVYLKLFQGVSFILTPLPILCTFTFLIGVISILMGLLAEILTRVYFETGNKLAYSVASKHNIEEKTD